jgi:hypothetical protein
VILLWGVPDDPPLALVRRELEGSPVAFLDQRLVLDTELKLDDGYRGRLSVGGQSVALEDITAAYIRPYAFHKIPVVHLAGEDSPEWKHALSLEQALAGWLDCAPAFVVNRPTPMAGNASKPFQLAAIERMGFAVPRTLVTTDPAAAQEFWSTHGEVIYKSVSGVRSIVGRLTARHSDRLESVRWCPTQFQEFVPGVDHRVHVIGGRVFTCRITSTGDDYRYAEFDGGSTEMHAAELPDDVAARCAELARALELPVAGIDLRLTPEGIWYCFEVNSSPGFEWFERVTGQRMGRALATLLRSPSGVPAGWSFDNPIGSQFCATGQ